MSASTGPPDLSAGADVGHSPGPHVAGRRAAYPTLSPTLACRKGSGVPRLGPARRSISHELEHLGGIDER